jgi:hypothetical protein
MIGESSGRESEDCDGAIWVGAEWLGLEERETEKETK